MHSAISFVRLYKDKADEWRWTAVAGNGEPVANGEGYSRKESAEESIRLNYGDVRVVEEA